MLAVFAALTIDPLFSAPTLAGAHVTAYAVNAQTGAVLYERGADDAMLPASTMKLLAGSAALDRLGTGFAFVTTLSTDGKNLYLTGGGDPLLAAADVDDAARTLDALKLTAFASLVGDAGPPHARYPDGWQVDDLPYDYAAPASALSFGENAVKIVVHPGAAAGSPATIDPPPVAIPIVENGAVTGAAGSTDTTALELDWQHPATIRVTGSVPAGAKPVELDASVLDAPQYALAQVARGLVAGHIAFTTTPSLGPAPAGARVVWTHRSPYLPDVLARMWQPSDNLLAESLFNEVGAGNEAAWLRTLGIDPATVTIADGSGMSAYDRVTARALVAILQHDWSGPNRQTVLDALPHAGTTGTLAHLFAAAPLLGHVIAKTGTSNHTRTLAGYVDGPRGTVIFALLVNGWMDAGPGADDRLHAFQAAVLTALAG
jgi:D-alanyl-D-alanine carboxypeptidase/D-alanyl-D-alanine-endopeptidase (penicillin-binding protein 4)